MPFELRAWIPVESEVEPYGTVQEAFEDKANQELMQPENRYEIVDTETDETIDIDEYAYTHAPVTDRKVICPECHQNLLEVGIEEVLNGGLTYTPIKFSTTGAIIGEARARDFSEQWIVCKGCNKDILEIHAVDIVDFNDGAIDDIEGIETHIEEPQEELL